MRLDRDFRRAIEHGMPAGRRSGNGVDACTWHSPGWAYERLSRAHSSARSSGNIPCCFTRVTVRYCVGRTVTGSLSFRIKGYSGVAKHQIIKLIDDLDGTEAQETVKFGLDGRDYEIDLSNKNAVKLRNLMAPYLEKGAKIDARRAVTVGGRTARGRGGAATEREQNKAIREWAVRKGIPVAPRGRIKQEIVDQYHKEAGR
jgi:nucleoid-associated protein Lsr2